MSSALSLRKESHLVSFFLFKGNVLSSYHYSLVDCFYVCDLGRHCTDKFGCWAWITSCNSWGNWRRKDYRKLCCGKPAFLQCHLKFSKFMSLLRFVLPVVAFLLERFFRLVQTLMLMFSFLLSCFSFAHRPKLCGCSYTNSHTYESKFTHIFFIFCTHECYILTIWIYYFLSYHYIWKCVSIFIMLWRH